MQTKLVKAGSEIILVMLTKSVFIQSAQRLGLVEQPKAQLDETEWALAKSKAQQRQDFSQPCVICKEDIGKLCHVSSYNLLVILMCQTRVVVV